MSGTNGRDRGGLMGLGWGGLDVPRLPAFMRGVYGQQAKAAEPLAGYTERLKEAATRDDLAGKVARALLNPGPMSAKARRGRLYRLVGLALQGGLRTKGSRGELYRRIGDILG